MTRLAPGSTQHENFSRKIVNISHNRQFCGFIFKFVWAVYGGDLIGFCQSFRKVILKNDQQQTKSKKSQKVPGYEPLWYAHSTALPQSYPASIGSGGGTPLEMWIIWDGRMLNYGLAGRSQNVLSIYTWFIPRLNTKKSIFFIVNPCLFWDRIWIRLRIWWRLVKEFFKKTRNWRSYRVGKFLLV